MKKLISLLSIPLILGFGGCNREIKEPVKEDYQGTIVPYHGGFVEDLDQDGVADVITPDNNTIALFYAEGYENKVDKLPSSKLMSPEMRKSATDFLKAYNELKYQEAKLNYNSKKNKGEKK